MTADTPQPPPVASSQKATAPTRCGVVALLGAPNAGKSTLLNALVGAKVSIVTHKVQTTRVRVRGVVLEGNTQIVLVDTPGIFSHATRRLERAMLRAAWDSAEDADAVVLIYDAAKHGIDPETEALVQRLKDIGRPVYLVLNKIDRIRRDKLLGLAAAFDAHGVFEATFMISARSGDGVADLKRALASRMAEGPWLYPEDQLCDFSLRVMAAELTREKLYLALHKELPYALTVETEDWQDFADGSVRLSQTIYVEREGQKKIVVGKGGAGIRRVREAVQAELARDLERPVHLFLFVKVRANWAEDPERYRDLGLDYDV